MKEKSFRNHFDVIIIGGSNAGLSAGMSLGRSLRNVLIIDSGTPCNKQTPHSHNFITQDGQPPQVIAQKAKEQVLNYKTVNWLDDLAISGKKSDKEFEITTQTGKAFLAKKLIIATGLKDMMPEIEGISECWGRSVIHCPYCHGYEVAGKRTGILANGDFAFHYAQLVSNLTKDLAIFTNGASTLTSEQFDKITKHNIPVIEKQIVAVKHQNGYLSQIVFKDDSTYSLDALYHKAAFIQQSTIPLDIGCEFTELGFIKTDAFQKTGVAGVFACGDSTSMMRSVANAVATGNLAGAMANSELVAEQF